MQSGKGIEQDWEEVEEGVFADAELVADVEVLTWDTPIASPEAPARSDVGSSAQASTVANPVASASAPQAQAAAPINVARVPGLPVGPPPAGQPMARPFFNKPHPPTGPRPIGTAPTAGPKKS